MSTVSRWLAENPIPKFPRLTRNINVDVVIIGGGMTGISAAYHLAKAGLSTALLERGRLGQGETGHTSAHLTYVTDSRLSELLGRFGRDHAQAVWDAGVAAIGWIEEAVRAEKIDCEFARVPGYLHAPFDRPLERGEKKKLKAEAALARQLGFVADYVESAPLVNRPAIRFANQAIFCPLQYLAGLAAAVRRMGGLIFEKTEAVDFSKSAPRIKANGHWAKYKHLVIATHVPLLGKDNLLSGTLFQTKLSGYSSYVIGARLPRNSQWPACYWSTADPYDYVRIDRQINHDYVVYGGEDHKTGQESDTSACYVRVEKKLRALLPAAKIQRRWSGQVIHTNDGLPYIGEVTPNQFIATGFVGNGITFGTLAGIMARDAFLGNKNPWVKLFAVHRKSLRDTWNYVKENADYPYYLLRDRLKSAEAGAPESLVPGEGKILEINGQKAACHRDASGKLHTVSAVCTHLGCLVHWNSNEKTWDCPCHGARFKPTGEVIAGPAETPLRQITIRRKSKRGKGHKLKPAGTTRKAARSR